MEMYGINVNYKNTPALNPDFIPLYLWEQEFLKDANEDIAIAVERENENVFVYETKIHGTDNYKAADRYYIERMSKLLLWAVGGFKITICGSKDIYEVIKSNYTHSGKRNFDAKTMANVYDKDFAVEWCEFKDRPKEKSSSSAVGGHLKGCRIGFDAGGSDRKVSAVIDGETVFSEETIWFPKQNSDPDYHYQGIVEAFKTAASKMPRVDAIGISSAGIYVNNRTKIASLFINVSKSNFKKYVEDIYIRAAKTIGDIPVLVANDGDVTALAGAMELNDNSVLGIAMGTSQAGGYVDKNGNITGCLNELAFIPVDVSHTAAVDEWSGDKGCGVKYFSQDAAILLAQAADLKLIGSLSLAEKLVEIQKEVEKGNEKAVNIFKSIGCYLAHTIPLYNEIYDIKHLLLLGRVTSGKGGEIMLEECKRVLSEDYPNINVNIILPDEKSRRVGQSVAAASLPEC